ncbi:hypothetical protein UFOVP965_92 [uncultured Caudovirales phage]|uniref:Uncharacterized protein n=1 Tax=uncultured Caudovirales phage TaxID=2100421 RepID=A0A6J5PUP6_9CAUD|nr:hypothetical protein UFOVP965_92 [uncultured Caudovirales phage]CAB4179865.1 hypothetical protein UFOVP1035_88 [uncultured Caudovirales phage]CAB4188667.1 hypothetical protein UFOVP1181_47 [uncultured Caudovirales phage]
MRFDVEGTFIIDVHTIIHADSKEEAIDEAKSLGLAGFDDSESQGFALVHIEESA